MATTRIHVPVAPHGRPSDGGIAAALAVLLTAVMSEEWTDNRDAEWAAMEGLERIAGAVGFAYRHHADGRTTVERAMPAAAAGT